ncbi:hypothetical protein F511_25528 [Dorcoceras hygrometricum]|uniref:DUF642 domain-containing protein n=1 Tax=Dorcoceras hygrometricum TaxID=472368 RepID=A0A2Z7AM28_9LAMI|nr:hypothetical protein F511_25528 [Dorcoceras hygrometricum]
MKLKAIFFTSVFLAIASADILQNPDFELPPSSWKENYTSPLFPLDANSSTIPGWTFEGAVDYATVGADLSLPLKGHAILLGQDGKINQSFTAKGDRVKYLLTFTLAIVGQNCKSNASLVVSAPDSSRQFSFSGKYGKELWEVYGLQIGSWGDGDSINLVLQSQAIDGDTNSTCWPVVDNLFLSTIGTLNQDKANLLPNGGFEFGPSFLESSNEGVLVDSQPSLIESALQQWTVMGTVKYIDSKSYFVPEGKSAVELVSGISAGVQTAIQLFKESSYDLEFMLGDANDSCTGDFTVGVLAGSTGQNFTIQSDGTGSAKKFSFVFKVSEPSPTIISFQSYTTKQRDDGVFCGPVIDAVVLHSSHGHISRLNGASLIALLLVALLKMVELP